MTRKKWIAAGVIIVGLILILRHPSSQLTNTGTLIEGDHISLTSTVSPSQLSGRPQVEINTSKGKFVIELRPDIAPKTVVNFLSKWSNSYCKGLTFHRVEDWVVQGCDPAGNGTGGSLNLPTETSGELFTQGAVGVARQATPKEKSNDSQFFIVKKDSLFLNSEYTFFGRVISGMDVVNRLAAGDNIISTDILTK